MEKSESPLLHVILYCSRIAQNVGNIGRTCAMAKARLHLIHPLGFEISDSKLKRSGMDYWYSLDVVHHASWEDFLKSPLSPDSERIWLLSTKAERSLWEADFRRGDGLLFGREDAGCPEFLHGQVGERRVKIPQLDANLRSLNLATSAGIATYEALRQILIA